MDEPADNTQETRSSISDLSILENETDEFGQQILEFARRDHRRLQDAISGNAQAFSKARPKPRVALTMENLERNAAQSSITPGNIATPPHSVSSEDRSNPSPNVPRQWGRKGRQKNDFLRRINSTNRIEEEKGSEKHPDAILPRRTVFTGDIDLTAESADLPVPSIETPPAQESWSRDAPSNQQRISPLDRIIELEREERSEHLLPPVSAPSGKTSLENLKQQHEIESIKDLAVTKSRLDEIGDRRSQRRRFLSERGLSASTSRDRTPDNLSDAGGAATQRPNGLENGDLDEEDRLTRESISQRLNSRRPDSREVLRQLARATSSSPSPGNGLQPSGHGRDMTPISKTPLVAGAWVDTPAPPPQSPLQANSQTQSANAVPIQTQREPQHPKSALEAMINEEREGVNADAFGDTTIDSLADILGLDESIVELNEETLELVNNVGVSVNTPHRERQKELKALQRMNEKLRVAKAGIRDASRGLRRVESQVEAAEDNEGVCARCGCPGGNAFSSFAHLWIAIRSPFYGWTKERQLRLTWLGMVSLTILLWSISEITLCEYYCQPRYAYTMTGFGVNIHAPRMPYVTTTVLFRPMGFLWRPILSIVRRVLGLVYQAVFLDGTSAGMGAKSAFEASTSSEFAQASGWAMSHDEYI